MKNIAIGHRLPYFLSKRLFGDRKRYGKKIIETDRCWIELTKNYLDFYNETQKKSIGHIINSPGYDVVSGIDFTSKSILEIGPGSLDHVDKWLSKPQVFYALDVNNDFMKYAEAVLKKHDVNYKLMLISESSKDFLLPLEDDSVDVILSFYSLEHLYPLKRYLSEIKRVLKPGGILAGAIPAEGGLAWGVGRYITSRRWLLKHTSIDPDKIICWCHPNFSDYIIDELNATFRQDFVSYWPFKVPLIDINFIIKFRYINEK